MLLVMYSVAPLHAQWYRVFTHPFTKQPKSVSALATQVKHHVQRVNVTAPTLQRSMLHIVETDRWHRFKDHPITGSAFVFVEEHNGKRQLWEITASHYSYVKPALKIPSQSKPIPVPFVAQSGTSDLLLFALPTEIEQFVTPLTLAKHPAQIGDKLHSMGFYENAFHFEDNILVRQNAPFRLITDMFVDPYVNRAGACGSPLLNEQNEVVGMHVGASKKQQIGFVVPVQQIRNLLQAYRQEGSFLQPLVFAGRTISEININEYIPAVQTFFAGKPLLRKNTFHAEKEINYAHLETLAPPLAGADTVVFVISRNRFSAREPLAQRTSLLIYNIYTGMVSVEPNTPHSRYYVPL